MGVGSARINDLIGYTQDGTRLVYVLTQIAKLHESVDIERRVKALEVLANEPK
jgi:hypothetical protein